MRVSTIWKQAEVVMMLYERQKTRTRLNQSSTDQSVCSAFWESCKRLEECLKSNTVSDREDPLKALLTKSLTSLGV